MKKKIKLFTGIYLIKKKILKNQIYYFLKTPKISIMISKVNNKFLVVSQNRIPIGKKLFEFPGGIVDKGQSAKKSAYKELFEETGYRSINTPKKIITLYPDPGRLDCSYEFFFTNKLEKLSRPEKGINVHLFTEKKILKLIKNRKFAHACHVAAFYFYISK